MPGDDALAALDRELVDHQEIVELGALVIEEVDVLEAVLAVHFVAQRDPLAQQLLKGHVAPVERGALRRRDDLDGLLNRRSRQMPIAPAELRPQRLL